MKASKVDPVFTMGADAVVSNPFLWSSTNWMLYEAGRLWRNGGRSDPVTARKSRGYAVHVQTAANDFIIAFVGDDLTPELRRL
jgi:hypothetical protein